MILASLPTWGIILLVFGAVLILSIMLTIFLPKLMPKGKKESEKEIAENEAKQVIVRPIINPFDLQKEKDEILLEIQRKEKKLNFVFSEDDLDGMILQVLQDRKDGFQG